MTGREGVVLVVAVMTGALVVCDHPVPPRDPNLEPIVRVVDADTVRLKSGSARLIGVDCPETVHPTKPVECYGPESSRFTHSALDGARVGISYGPEKEDRYGRLLVYIGHRGRDFNLGLISTGHCRAYRRFKHPRRDAYIKAEQSAKEKNIGLWKSCQ
jgi:micrococcal nuclease